MDTKLISLSSFCAILVAGIWFTSQNRGRHHCSVLIGVLSARENVVLRNAARATWLRDVTARNIQQWCQPVFVLGDTPCYVHPLDREDIFGCKRLNLSKKCEHQLTSCRVISQNVQKPQFAIAHFAFKGNVDIVVRRLGILNSLLPRHAFPATVSLFDAITEAKVCSIALTSAESGVEVDGYVYRSVQSCVLSRGFEGIVRVQLSDMEILKSPVGSAVTLDTGGDLISFFNMNVEHYDDGEIGALDTRRPLAASIMFGVQNCSDYENHVQLTEHRAVQWETDKALEEVQLQQEAQRHGDIVFVSQTDVYRNLPKKLLSFYDEALAMYSFDFLLKTDDDTILNTEAISQSLLEIIDEERNDNIWWGRFRINWKVYRFGKWAERDYNAVSYPPFACGTANVISSGLVEWLSQNKNNLHSFQGEDTSTGIWLAAVQPHYEDDPRWGCGDHHHVRQCGSETFSLGQMSAEGIRAKWKLLQRCKSLCETHCHNL